MRRATRRISRKQLARCRRFEMVQRERAHDDVERRVGERQPFALAVHERQAFVAAGAPRARSRASPRCGRDTSRARDAAPATVADQRVRDVACAAAHIEDRPGAGAPHLARIGAIPPSQRLANSMSRRLRRVRPVRRPAGPSIRAARQRVSRASRNPSFGGGPAQVLSRTS